MSALSRRPASSPALSAPTSPLATEQPSEELPAWASDFSLSGGNAAIALLVTGSTMSEDEASSLLNGSANSPSQTPFLDAAAQSEHDTSTQAPSAQATPVRRPTGLTGRVYAKHENALADGVSMKPTSEHKWAMEFFKKRYEQNQGRYATVAAKTGIPAKLIAALHYRESSMDFGTYLHQGDPLGRPAVHVPKNIPVFTVWEDAAVHALNMKRGIRDELGMDEGTTDLASMATYAEMYNGLGYHNKDRASPYVYAGTDEYRGGKYVRDGVYDSRVWDRNPGVLALVGSLDGEVGQLPTTSEGITTTDAWQAVLDGHHVVRQGQRGPAVRALQEKLLAAGFRVSVDGEFGNKTADAVRAFQQRLGLEADGRVGSATAQALDRGAAPVSHEPTTPVSDAPAAEAPATESTRPAAQPDRSAWQAVASGEQTLRLGSRGEAVRALQERLVAAGYPVSVDGAFGPRTRAAVKALQRAQGLDVDGLVGPRTAGAL